MSLVRSRRPPFRKVVDLKKLYIVNNILSSTPRCALLASFFEGSAVMMTAGLLWHLGTVEFLPAYAALMAGDLLADIMWYVIGHYGARSFFERWGHFFGATPEILEKAERRFNQYHTKILIFSKLTMGLGLAVPILIAAGMMRVPFTRFAVI